MWRHQRVAQTTKTIADLPMISTLVALLAPEQAALKAALITATLVLDLAADGQDEDREVIAERQIAVLEAAMREHNAFNQIYTEVVQAGGTVPAHRLTRHLMLTGYYARVQFRSTDPNCSGCSTAVTVAGPSASTRASSCSAATRSRSGSCSAAG